MGENRGQSREILSEEEYSAALSRVIENNYFPDLPKLKTQIASLERHDSGFQQNGSIRELLKSQLEEESSSLLDWQRKEKSTSQQGATKLELLERQSLTNFHRLVTSEDNANFESNQRQQIQQRQEQRLRNARHAMSLLIGPSDPVPQKPGHPPTIDTPLIMASDQFNASPHRHVLTRQQTEKAAQDNNTLFFVPSYNSQRYNNQCSQQEFLEGKSDPGESSTNINDKSEVDLLALMPPPQPHLSKDKKMPFERNHDADKMRPSPVDSTLDNSKKICPEATRFPTLSARFATSLQDAVEGDDRSSNLSEVYTASDASTDLNASPKYPIEVELEKARKRKLRENETLVPMTPIIVPWDGPGDHEHEPITKWGERYNSTPLVLAAAAQRDKDEPVGGPMFTVAEPTSRETVAERVLKGLQDRGRQAATPQRKKRPPTTYSSNSSTPRSSQAFGTALRASYSQRPQSYRQSTPLQQHRTVYAATPQLNNIFKKKEK